MITIENLTKKFDDLTALDKVTCTIPDGIIYGLVGSNGAGKSTLLRTISGVYQSDGGKVEYDGESVWNNEKVKEKLCFIPDDLYFLPGSSLNRMAKMYASFRKTFDYEKFDQLIELFDLNRKKAINTFSKGMKRQAAVILALACKPQYIFFDETFDGLDPVMRNQLKKLLWQDAEERKSTVILSSHSLRELEDTCDQLALLHKGGIVFERDVQNLKTNLFKIQVAFDYDYTKEIFNGIKTENITKHGSISNIIAKGEKEEIVTKLKGLNPKIIDILPLSLEEVFIYEMEALGYSAETLGGKEDENQ